MTFLVNDFRLAASNLCVYKYAVLVLLKLAECTEETFPLEDVMQINGCFMQVSASLKA